MFCDSYVTIKDVEKVGGEGQIQPLLYIVLCCVRGVVVIELERRRSTEGIERKW